MAATTAKAEMFRNEDFLTWKPGNRAAYVEISVGMALLIAVQVAPDKADCIESWYYARPNEALAEVYETMAAYPDHHPRGIILAFIRKRCQVFLKK